MIHFEETRFGFDFGALCIERICSDEKKGWVVVGIKTPREKDWIKVYVTKTGKVRIWKNDKELK